MASGAGNIRVALQLALEGRSATATGGLSGWVDGAARAHFGRRVPRCSLTVRLVGSAEGSELNEAFRGANGPTNVLAFPAESMPEVDEEFPELGDIVICVPVVEREATEQDKDFEAHLAHMVVHGTLHLLGYDHYEDQEAELMESTEQRVLARLGFPDPYRDGDRTSLR